VISASTTSIGALLDSAAASHGARAALVHRDRRITYTELRDDSLRTARALAALGVVKGTHVGLLLPNSPQWLSLAFGALRLGAVLVPLNTLSTPRELAHALRHADVHVLVMVARFLRHAYLDTVVEFCPGLRAVPSPRGLESPEFPTLRHVIVAEEASLPHGVRPLAAILDGHAVVPAALVTEATRQCELADRAAIFFTSGSTALPKGVVHTHGSMLASADNIRDTLGLAPDDVTWGYLPFFFTGGFVAIAMASLAAGASVVLQETFDAGEAVRLLETTGCTVLFGWPHQIQAIIEHPSFDRAKLKIHKGVGANTAWAPAMYPERHHAVGTYGMTESGPMSVASRWDDSAELRARCHGRPQPGVELRIIDPAGGAVCEPEEEGEILLRGRTMMEGYYRAPREEAFDRDGFFHTGDRGRLDRDGCLHFLGRLKDVIKTAGVNVAASEIEAVLRQHPAVREAYVVGVPHPTRGENPAAFVIPDGTVDTDELLAFCRERLASYKVPRHIFFRQEHQLPSAGSGKVLKQRLQEEAATLVGTS
jgi:acyl-CoA synthetase (AMP-forming)/AMP-acid ligase II